MIAHQKLQSMCSGGKFYTGFRLTSAEVQVIVVGWNILIERRKRRVDDNVMMPCIRPFNARRRDTDATRPHPQPKLSALDDSPVTRPDDIDLSILRRGRIAGKRPGYAPCH